MIGKRDSKRALKSSLFLIGLVLAGPAAAQLPVAPVSTPMPAADAFFADPALAETRAIIVLKDGKRI